MKKIKTSLFSILFCTQIFAQNLINIPDQNLKKELIKQSFTTNDSLDIRKIKGLLQLDLRNKKIQNLDGLQYFKRVWRLNVSNNDISNLKHLPPNLTALTISENQLTRIDSLPNGIKHLRCDNNNIDTITNLPNSLTSIAFSNNRMIELPLLPKKIQYLNYYQNPIATSKLPSIYQLVDCENSFQNCLPNELVQWNPLNNSLKDSVNQIIKMTLTFTSSYSWGQGSKVETIEYELKKSKLVAKQIHQKVTKGLFDVDDKKQITEISEKTKNSVCASDIQSLLSDIYNPKLVMKIPFNDSVFILNLKNKKNGESCSGECDDCNNYKVLYTFYSQSDTMTVSYQFDGVLDNGITLCSQNRPENLKEILDWIFMYKLTNLTLSNHLLVDRFFTEQNLNPIIKWEKEYKSSTITKK